MTTSSVGFTLSGRSSRRSDALLVALLTLLALLLRAARLDFQPLWWDEGYSVWFAHQPLADMIRLTALDIHPPLYYALLGGWSKLFGLGPVALRWLSVAAGVAAVPLIYLVGYGLSGRRVGLIAAFLLAINPLHIYYSQEVRMYALVALWALLAIGMAGRWLGLGRRIRGDTRPASWGWLAGYVAAITLALYTQYYAAFLLVGLAMAGGVVLWRLQAGRQRILFWLAAQGVAVLLFLPWILYAAPKLVPYVSQKIVADSDQPLGLLLYLARHLAVYSAGHLEEPLMGWWPLGLLGVILLAAGLIRLARRRPLEPGHGLVLSFLGIILGVVLGLGWLVNLTYPFFPERGERLLLLGLPAFILLLAATWAPPDPVRSPGQRIVVLPPRSPLPRLFVAGLTVLAALSLAAFYTVPRYTDEDYRPLIGQVRQWGRSGDTVFAVFPWQVGYFWSYGQPDGPQPELSPGDDWGPQVSAALAGALNRGRVWFPMHQSMGGMLEDAAQQYLAQNNYQLVNRWYSPSTRLTGWIAPQPGSANIAAIAASATFDGGVQVDVLYVPRSLTAANDALPVKLEFSGLNGSYLASLRLTSADGRIWAQRDVLVEQDGMLRVGLLAPAGMPAGRYDLRLSLAHPSDARPVNLLEPAGQGSELTLGQIDVQAPAISPPLSALPMEHSRETTLGDAARLLGYSATPGPLLPGNDLTVNLFWQALAGAANTDLSAFVQLLDRQGQVAAGWEGPPVPWRPTGDWQTDELLRSQHTLRLPAVLPAGRYTLVAGLFDPATGERLPASWQGGPFGVLSRSAQQAELGQVQIGARKLTSSAPEPRVSTDASLERLGRLVGYDLADTRVAPGGALDLVLYWQPTETTGERLTVFVHLVDEQGVIVGQSDSEPAGGSRPTSSWLPDEFIADRHSVRVHGDALLGPATLLVGLYDPATGQRVSWIDAGGQITGDALRLPTAVRVTTVR
jgi:4-amino-4-deoxy-L-arabinose transferase-like glycosyltransferase